MRMLFRPGLELSVENGTFKGKTNLCGWKDGRYILLDVPGGWSVKHGQSIISRFYHDGSYCGFASEVTGHYPEINVAELKFPNDIIESSVRKNGRYPTAIPVEVGRQPSSGGSGRNGLITDISLGGLRFSCHMMFRVGEKVFLDFTIPTGDVVKSATVTVRSMKAFERKYEYGGEFDSGDKVTQAAISKLIGMITVVPFDDLETDQAPAANQLNIPVDGNLQLQIGMLKLNTTFRGAGKKHLLIDAPTADGKPLIVARGMAGIVRYANAGMAYGFETEIVKQYTSPAKLWALSHPGSVRGICLRKSARMKTFIPAALEEENGHTHSGVIVDMSESGSLFVTAEDFKTDSMCAMSFILPTGQRIERLLCHPKNVKKTVNSIMVGLSFNGGNSDNIRMLRSYYESCRQHLL